MKKLMTVLLFGVIIICTCQAQNVYSKQFLSQASDDKLGVLLNKATNLKKVGKNLTIAGSVSFLVGVGVGFSFSDSENYIMDFAAAILLLGGLTADLVGIPLLIKGSSRVKRVNSYMQGLTYASSLKITPCSINYHQGNQSCPGIRFTISF